MKRSRDDVTDAASDAVQSVFSLSDMLSELRTHLDAPSWFSLGLVSKALRARANLLLPPMHAPLSLLLCDCARLGYAGIFRKSLVPRFFELSFPKRNAIRDVTRAAPIARTFWIDLADSCYGDPRNLLGHMYQLFNIMRWSGQNTPLCEFNLAEMTDAMYACARLDIACDLLLPLHSFFNLNDLTQRHPKTYKLFGVDVTVSFQFIAALMQVLMEPVVDVDFVFESYLPTVLSSHEYTDIFSPLLFAALNARDCCILRCLEKASRWKVAFNMDLGHDGLGFVAKVIAYSFRRHVTDEVREAFWATFVPNMLLREDDRTPERLIQRYIATHAEWRADLPDGLFWRLLERLDGIKLTNV